jgi:hypothetical protein
MVNAQWLMLNGQLTIVALAVQQHGALRPLCE